ncbi:hypothetical protein Tsubulata_005935 [Turnera subulata]|uniref:DUF4283 domain-containing protein n=1 Tax=Turnera subulata TaxID=218843 RepID=A0A9Q0GCW7_9ROSI|nr:hypothetical protein Tsubulata_005935 [Turnera subulata]
MDVYIPNKLSRAGRRFAFVRYRNNVHIPSLLNSINSKHVDNVELVATVAKTRHEGKGKLNGKGNAASRLSDSVDMGRYANSDRSFVEAVRMPRSPVLVPGRVMKDDAQPPANSAFLAKYNCPPWLKCCALGVLKNPMPFQNLLDLFPANESPVINVILIGGVSFLFRFKSVADLNETYGNQPTWFNQLFTSFRQWREGDAATNRLCWVLVKGTPPSAWSEDFFRLLVSGFRSMVDWSSESRSLVRMDVAEVLILTSANSSINKDLAVKIGDKSSIISIAESQYNPLDWVWSKPTTTASSSFSQGRAPADEDH